jgi:23S rRNA pseudouridine1911/1915/1917 synthase
VTARLDRAVADLLGCGRGEAQRLVTEGQVRVGGRVVRRPAAAVDEDAAIEVDAPERPGPALEPDPSVPFTVVAEDEAVIVVDKPAGVVVHPGAGQSTGTLVQGLLAHDPGLAGVGPDPQRPGIVHRLDRGTSGLLVVARTPAAYEALVAQLGQREVGRTYDVLVAGRVAEAAGRIEAPIGRSPERPTLMAVLSEGRPAATDYEVAERFGSPEPLTRLTCRLETGRTHQIRVHLAAIGHPVLGDAAYGGTRPTVPLHRPFLHATALAFRHPATGEEVSYRSPLPEDLQSVLDGLRSGAGGHSA